MADYIDKSKIVFRNLWDYDETGTGICIKAATADEIYAIPPVDVRPVVRSKWKKNDNGTYSCKRCHSWIPKQQWHYANYCLYCGAYMYEGE